MTRQVQKVIKQGRLDTVNEDQGWSNPKGGAFSLNAPSQQVIERTSCTIKETAGTDEPTLELRFTLGLPAAGRAILGDQARDLLTKGIPMLIQKGLLFKVFEKEKVEEHIRSVQVQQALRDALGPRDLVAFIGNGSILPRKSGASALPMKKDEAVPFKSPGSLEVCFTAPIPFPPLADWLTQTGQY